MPAAKVRSRNRRTSTMGAGCRRSRATKRAPRTTDPTMAPTTATLAHPSWLPCEMANTMAATAGKKSASPSQSKADPALEVTAPGHEDQRRHDSDQPDGNVDQEDEAPAAGRQQQATHRWAEGQPEGLGRALDAERTPEPRRWHGQGDDGHAVGLEHGRTDGLEGPEGVEGEQARSRRTQRRAGDEDGEAVDVEELAADHVGKAADGGHRGHQHQ